MIQFGNAQVAEPVSQVAPPPLPPAATGGPMAGQVYHNVKVLTDVSAAEFMRLQSAITQWVSPSQGCDYCHVGKDYESDAKATKVAARWMLQMVRHMNATWTSHLAPVGVTCFTCHRGSPVPAETWFPTAPAPVHQFVAKQEPWNESADTVRKFFPDAGWDEYFLQDEPIAVQSTTALPTNSIHAQIVAKRVYEMMMQMADGIGVNCGYCHNSRAFEDWGQSTPARWTGYYGIKLVQDLNRNFMLRLSGIVPLQRALVREQMIPVIPQREAGIQGGNGMIVCATCHYGEPDPIHGAAMLRDYPGLTGATALPAASATPPATHASAAPRAPAVPPT
jgi:photosynthetic reaction center cytochrome c subunit